MSEDRFGLPLSTSNADARDAYVAGVDSVISGVAGYRESLAQALARDPWFALAHEPQTVRIGGSRAERRAHLPQLLDGTRRVGR